jgi:hypothetical protein
MPKTQEKKTTRTRKGPLSDREWLAREIDGLATTLEECVVVDAVKSYASELVSRVRADRKLTRALVAKVKAGASPAELERAVREAFVAEVTGVH